MDSLFTDVTDAKFSVTQEEWTHENPAVYNKIREIFGDEKQIIQTIQEMAEFTKALTRYLLGIFKDEDYAEIYKECVEELADAQLMLNQMKDMFGQEQVERAMQMKLDRLLDRMVEKGQIVREVSA